MRWRRVVLACAMLLGIAIFNTGAAAGAAEEIGPERVYFPQTGHYLSYAFLDYWHHHGGVPVFGYPISEETTDPDTALTVQYFERAVLEWHPYGVPAPAVQVGHLGSRITAQRKNESPFQRVVAAGGPEVLYFAETGHRLANGFRVFWEKYWGPAVLGDPISEEFTENGITVQYFENARLEWHPGASGGDSEIQLGLLGVEAAWNSGIARSSLGQSQCTPSYAPDLWYTPGKTKPSDVKIPPPGAPACSAKWIEVDLSAQYLRAWEYNKVVFSQYVSTGTARHPTPTGNFSIFSRVTSQRMTNRGWGAPGDIYDLPNVPWVQYFAAGGYSFHGTYWHNNFGHTMSHGCVNMTTPGAKWLYDWAGYGTPVWIHY